MDFGRLPNNDGVDFRLPPIRPRSRLESLAPQGSRGTQIRLGTPSWSTPDFAKRFYPKGTATAERPTVYSQSFHSIELDSTFYALPAPDLLDRWKNAVSAPFRFCPKFPQEITHHKILRDCAADGVAFVERLLPLGPHLGRSILQLAPSYEFRDGQRLKSFLETLPRRFPVAVEFRHASWFEHGQVKERVVDYLDTLGVALVVTDVAGHREVCHSSLSAGHLVVRFQGYELHPSDFTRLEAWADRLAELRERGLRECDFFLHQHEQNRSLDMAGPFRQALVARGFENIPEPLIPREEEARKPEVQASLF